MVSGMIALPWWGYVIVTLALTHVTIAGVTIFLHRHQAHRALDLHPAVAHFFRLWLWLTTGMVTREWAAIHRKHHAKCETADDPHSPQVLGLNRVLWAGVILYVKESHKAETMERYGHGTPDDWLERHIYTPLQKFGIVLMAVFDVALFGIWPGLLMWGVQMIWIPFWAAGVVNGVGHFWGYRNFATSDASANILPWGILIGGEELHNNHHAYASSAKLSSKWYEFDIGWAYIRILQALRLATVKKVASPPRLRDAPPLVDVETLQAVLTHRYDVLSRYLRSLRQVVAEEVARLQIDARQRRLLKRWADAEAGLTPVAEVVSVLEKSERLSILCTMRGELEAIWQRGTSSHEQLLVQLQDWIRRAEASGIRQLEEFSLRLRRYAS